jgi:DNA-binding transcriptional LysR family regulator
MNPTLCFHYGMSIIHTHPAAGEDSALPERLARIDLNLLVAFDALAREQNVTRAAERMGVTQSAMSHSLRRLRELLADPLLVRGQNGMKLTARAEALVVPLRSGLVTVDRALTQPERFVPERARRSFRLLSPDLFDVLAIPLLLERIRVEAPGIDLVVVVLEGRRRAESLESGEVDLVITPRFEEFQGGTPRLEAAGLLRRTLFHDGFSCFLRDDHPALPKRGRRSPKSSGAEPLSLETYAGLSHALVSPRGEGPGLVDELLAKQGLSRRVALRVPHFFSALAIVEKSDLILTGPSALVNLLGSRPVLSLPAPLRLPRHALHMVWHERFTNDPGHGWLRDLVADVSQRIVS